MLSRRDKLLIQPWEERRYKDHRSKVRSARAAVEARAPPPRPHVARDLKLCRREEERRDRIQSDNFSLLQRLAAIMKVNRLDNHWPKPLPNFQRKVGMFYDIRSLKDKLSARASPEEGSSEGHNHVKCYACDLKKKKYDFKGSAGHEEFLPSINSK